MKKCVALPTSSLRINEQRLGIGSAFTHLRMCPEKCQLESDHRTPRYLAKYYFWVCLWGCSQKTLVFELESRVTQSALPCMGGCIQSPGGLNGTKGWREGRLALSGWPLSWDFHRLPSFSFTPSGWDRDLQYWLPWVSSLQMADCGLRDNHMSQFLIIKSHYIYIFLLFIFMYILYILYIFVKLIYRCIYIYLSICIYRYIYLYIYQIYIYLFIYIFIKHISLCIYIYTERERGICCFFEEPYLI